jgi:hypothetical protein
MKARSTEGHPAQKPPPLASCLSRQTADGDFAQQAQKRFMIRVFQLSYQHSPTAAPLNTRAILLSPAPPSADPQKFAVPICTALAPTRKNSTTTLQFEQNTYNSVN